VPAISDSSPLILYGRIGRLDLLQQVFGQVLVPPAVWREVVAAGAGRAGSDLALQAAWIRREPLPTEGVGALALSGLGPGEVEVIALALAMASPILVILDDERARRVAERSGLFVIGSAGVLLLAKDAGLVSSIAPVLADLRAAGLYLAETAAARILETAGEG
jgi:uncharacterized protein